MKHYQLVLGLNQLGFHDSGTHGLEILDIVTELMKVPINKRDKFIAILYLLPGTGTTIYNNRAGRRTETIGGAVFSDG